MVKAYVGRSNSKSITTIKKAEKYFKNRDKALLSFDLKIIKDFVEEYKEFMGMPIPNDEVMYAAAMKAIVNGIPSATEEQIKRASNWLLENGFDLKMGAGT